MSREGKLRYKAEVEKVVEMFQTRRTDVRELFLKQEDLELELDSSFTSDKIGWLKGKSAGRGPAVELNEF
jgi:hypothetical protein